ncbi:hypothetical protein JCM3765_007797 [Sporobolomyces pararoseus]
MRQNELCSSAVNLDMKSERDTRPTPRSAEPLTSPGNCVVCGKSTWLRCSDCAKYGIGYMYFCGIEHKKLVYSVHRRVCGIRANPFQWPGLSLEEYRKVERDLHLLIRARGDGKSNIDPSFFVQFREPPKGERLSQDLMKPLIGLRFFASGVGASTSVLRNTGNVMARRWLDPLDCALRLISKLLPGFETQDDGSCPWFTQFHHKILILSTVLTLGDNTEELQNAGDYLAADFQNFCQTTIATSHPKEAKIIVDYFISSRKVGLNDQVEFEERTDRNSLGL